MGQPVDRHRAPRRHKFHIPCFTLLGKVHPFHCAAFSCVIRLRWVYLEVIKRTQWKDFSIWCALFCLTYSSSWGGWIPGNCPVYTDVLFGFYSGCPGYPIAGWTVPFAQATVQFQMEHEKRVLGHGGLHRRTDPQLIEFASPTFFGLRVMQLAVEFLRWAAPWPLVPRRREVWDERCGR